MNFKILKRKKLEELKRLIEPDRYLLLSKIILFNKTYAEYLLNFDKFRDIINHTENHLFWSGKNELLESAHVRIYGFNKDKSWDSILQDNQLKPLLISYLGIKSILQNDKKIFKKWQLSFDRLAEDLNESIYESEGIPDHLIKKFKELIKEIGNSK